MAFDKIFRGSPSDLIVSASPESPHLGVDIVNDLVYVNTGNGWAIVGSSSGGGVVTPPDSSLIAPNGGTTYSLGFSPLYPTASMYFVNGIKRIYGTYYTISGSTLTLLTPDLPNSADGDTHEIYAS